MLKKAGKKLSHPILFSYAVQKNLHMKRGGTKIVSSCLLSRPTHTNNFYGAAYCETGLYMLCLDEGVETGGIPKKGGQKSPFKWFVLG